MEPRNVTHKDVEEKIGMQRIVMHAPENIDNCSDAQVLIAPGLTMIPFMPDEIEVAQLAKGGTVWLILHTERMPPVALIVEDS